MEKQIILNKLEIEQIISETQDIYRDFYITKNNVRYFIKDNVHLLWEAIEKGDKIYFGNNFVIYVGGFSDNADRKYMKILFDDKVDGFSGIIRNHCLDFKTDIYIKIKKNNPIIKVLEKTGFKYIANRGKEVLYCWVNAQKDKHVR